MTRNAMQDKESHPQFNYQDSVYRNQQLIQLFLIPSFVSSITTAALSAWDIALIISIS